MYLPTLPAFAAAGVASATMRKHAKSPDKTAYAMRLLDLFCGAGGSAVGYHRAGFDEIVGVDNRPQKNYPFEFVLADALEYVAGHGHEFDAIHASPPCQAYSSLKVMPNAQAHPELVQPTRAALTDLALPYVIENVMGAPVLVSQPSLLHLLNGVLLCGSMFGLSNGTHELRRHRLFESNVVLRQPACLHRLPVIYVFHWLSTHPAHPSHRRVRRMTHLNKADYAVANVSRYARANPYMSEQ